MNDFNMMTDRSCAALTPTLLGRAIGGFLVACFLLASLVSTSPLAAASQEQQQGQTDELVVFGGPAAGMSTLPGEWGDDTIGALPVIGDNGTLSFSGLPNLTSIMLSSGPSLYLEGTVPDLKRMILDADGDLNSFVYVESIAGGQARLFLQGAASIELDLSLFKTGKVRVGMFTGLEFDQSLVTFETRSDLVSNSVLNPAVLTLVRLQTALNSGLLEDGGLHANLRSSTSRASGSLSFSSETGRIVLQQFQ